MKKTLNRKGIFLTFMAFLLVSTVIVLSISIKQAEISHGKSLAYEAALKEVGGRFSNLRQQITVTKEGTASAAYGRFTPFKKFRADSNWVEIEQSLPVEGKHLENMYDALNLFAIFAKEKGAEGMDFRTQSVLQTSQWNTEETDDPYPTITYAVLPQCLLFSVSKDRVEDGIIDENAVFRKGTASDGCKQGFEADSVARYDIEVRLPDVIQDPVCQEAFAGCDEKEDNGSMPYARILLIAESCTPDCTTRGFDAGGRKEIAGNLSSSGSASDLVNIETGSGDTVSIRFNQPDAEEDEVLEIAVHSTGDQLEESKFKARVIFEETIDEIMLLPGSFEFSVKKQGFDYCRATSEAGCS